MGVSISGLGMRSGGCGCEMRGARGVERRLHLPKARGAAAAAVTPVAAIAPAILAATAGAAERCDVWEGRNGASVPECKKMGV